MMQKNPYQMLDKYVLRTPLLPLSFFKSLNQGNGTSTEALKEAYMGNTIIQEALFLASPILSERLEKWCINEIKDKKEVEKITNSLMKYLSRMCSRCTPFGLFAATGLGQFDALTKIELAPYDRFKRHTRLDMNYLVALSQHLAKTPLIRQQLLFYPNSSLYRVGKEWRYIEYHYGKDNRRVHQMVSLEDTDYLREIIKLASKGIYLSDLLPLLTDEETTSEEAADFIGELVDSQLLISELEPSVSGPEFSTQLMACLKKLKGVDTIVDLLDQASAGIRSLDGRIGNGKDEYFKVTASLKSLGTSIDSKHMFQTDMKLSYQHNTLGESVKEKVLSAMELLARISPKMQETRLQRFGKAFYERYEAREIPLARALDVEVGIGYKQDQGGGDVNYLIDDIMVPGRREQEPATFKLSVAQQVLHKKLVESNKLQQRTIQLKATDFKELSPDWEGLADTLPTMIQVLEEEGEEKISISAFGGSSAANLLARFCHGDEAIDQHTRQIVEHESDMNPEKIIAEIVHLPEARVGNILMRPAFRKYEIPYLAKSVLPVENQLGIEDLVVSAKPDGTVILKSVSKGKEVIPRLSNAHNFSNSSLPIYHFLGDLQTQGQRVLGFGWGSTAELYQYLPRVEYQGVILSSAQWNMSKKDLESMFNATNDEELNNAVLVWKDQCLIPRYVLLIESDNELLIDTDDLTSIRMLLNELKSKDRFKLGEFLHKETPVKQGLNQYTNQVVLTFVNAQKLKLAKQ